MIRMLLAGIFIGMLISAVAFMVGAVLVYEDKYGPFIDYR